MKVYGENSEVAKKANELIGQHKALGLTDEQAKAATILSITLLFTEGGLRRGFSTTALFQKVYNHLTGTPCPFG